MALQDKAAVGFKARVSVSLQPVNKYGDVIRDDAGDLTYTIVMEGSLVDVVTRLERLRDK